MSINLPLTVKIMLDKRSSDAPYVVYCPELDVASCGPTEEKARSMLKDAIEITLREAHKQGTLEKYLEEVGFFKDDKKGVFISPKVSYEPYYFSVPKFLAAKFACLV